MIRHILPLLLFLLSLMTGHDVFASERDDIRNGTVSVAGTSSESFTPDTAEITLAVETSAVTVSEATSMNSAASEKVLHALSALIDKSQGDMIRTSTYSIQPKYEYENRLKKNRLIGYTVSNQITVTTGKISESGRLIDHAIEQGANRVYGITFSIADDRLHCDSLLKEASKRGRHEAEIVTHSLGVSIAGIKSVSSSCTHMNQPPVFPGGYARAAALSGSETAIEPGGFKLSATVNLIFYIDNGQEKSPAGFE